MELTDDMIRWIGEHASDDTSRLRFRDNNDPATKFCILQIECRRHASKKLPQTLKCNQFQFPTSLSAEQCTSDYIAAFHASLVSPGETVLDMTAGLGIDAFHMARRGAHVTAIDINPDVAEALTHNAEALQLPLHAVCGDSVSYIQETAQQFDTIFIDPARRGKGGQRLFALSDCMPDVVSLLPLLRKRCHRLIIKASPMIDIDQTLREIPDTTRLYVTGTRHECKELAVVCDFGKLSAERQPEIIPLTINGNGDRYSLSFVQNEERTCCAAIADPHPGQIMYEPYPAVMKSGAYKLLSARYGCTKLHANTHLYVTDSVLPDFPGTPYAIMQIIPFQSKEIKQINRYVLSGSVAVRNFIMSAEELKRKLKLKEDSSQRIIGTTTKSGRILIVVKPLCELD